MIEELNTNNFDEKIKAGKVIVDCYAIWCGPCKMLAPIIEEVSKEVDSYSFYKMDVDNCEEISRRYGIMSIPTLLIFEDGQLKTKTIGFKTKEELLEILK